MAAIEAILNLAFESLIIKAINKTAIIMQSVKILSLISRESWKL